MPTLQYIPPWTVSYSYSVEPSVIRSPSLGGRRGQVKVRDNKIVVASASRVLIGAELPYFEYFIREILKDGSLKYTDVYADHNGLNTGTVRILGGVYNVSTDKRNSTLTCDLEIFS